MTKTANKKVQYTKIIIKIVIHTYQLNNKNGQGETLESIQTIKHGFHRPFCIYMFKLYNYFLYSELGSDFCLCLFRAESGVERVESCLPKLLFRHTDSVKNVVLVFETGSRKHHIVGIERDLCAGLNELSDRVGGVVSFCLYIGGHTDLQRNLCFDDLP